MPKIWFTVVEKRLVLNKKGKRNLTVSIYNKSMISGAVLLHKHFTSFISKAYPGETVPVYLFRRNIFFVPVFSLNFNESTTKFYQPGADYKRGCSFFFVVQHVTLCKMNVKCKRIQQYDLLLKTMGCVVTLTTYSCKFFLITSRKGVTAVFMVVHLHIV